MIKPIKLLAEIPIKIFLDQIEVFVRAEDDSLIIMHTAKQEGLESIVEVQKEKKRTWNNSLRYCRDMENNPEEMSWWETWYISDE